MRILLLLLLLNHTLVADGIDQVTVRLNGRPVFDTRDVAEEILLDLHVGDTLLIIAWTDWGGLNNLELVVSDEAGREIQKLNRLPDRQYKASFLLIVDQKLLNRKLHFTFLYDPEDHIQPWNFLDLKPES